MLLNEEKDIQGQDTIDKKPEPIGEAPPSYEASTSAAGGTSLSRPTAVIPPVAGPSTAPPALSGLTPSSSMRSNFTKIITPHRGITSKAVIDLALPELPNPHAARFFTSDYTTYDGSRPNLYLSSQYHTVQASLHITDSSFSNAATSPAKRALIVAESENGNVTVEIASRIPSARLHICAGSKSGNIIIRIPKDFHGRIICRTDPSQHNQVFVRYTPQVRANMTVLSMHETEAYAFIGDASALQAQASQPIVTDAKLPLESREQQYNMGSSMPSASTSTSGATTSSWTGGDQVEVIANNGRVKICYALLEGEEKEQEGELNTLVRYVQESGPIAAIVKFAARGVTKVIQDSKKKREQRE